MSKLFTPVKESKRCHVTTNLTPSVKKKTKADGKAGIRRVLEYTTARREKTFKATVHKSLRVISSPKHLTFKRKCGRAEWSTKEDIALVEYIGLHKDKQASEQEWPSMRASNSYWETAAKYIKDLTGAAYIRTNTSVRQRVVNNMRKYFTTVKNAEDALGITVEYYLQDGNNDTTPRDVQATTFCSSEQLKNVLQMAHKLTSNQCLEVISNLLRRVSSTDIKTLLPIFFQIHPTFIQHVLHATKGLQVDNLLSLSDVLVRQFAAQAQVTYNLEGFVEVAVKAMTELEKENKPNLIYLMSRCLGEKREDGRSLMPMDRMPFGLIQYQLEFFSSTHITQITEAPDFKIWLETMEAEFGGGKFKRLFRGPMWSSCPRKDVGIPEKAKVNVASISSRTQNKRSAQSQFTSKPEVQIAALEELKLANPDGRFWIKVDGTDVKPALLESMRKEWNGDVNLGDGMLEKLRGQYDGQVQMIGELTAADQERINLEQNIRTFLDQIEEDLQFLITGLAKSRQIFQEKLKKPTTSDEKLRCLNWEVVEYQMLLEQAENWKSLLSDFLSQLDPLLPDHAGVVRAALDDNREAMLVFQRNMFKKKRQPAATHVLVLMVSDEKRDQKPYALPVQYVPYYSLRDQYIRDFTKVLKQNMTRLGLSVAGTVTDGEFVTLRSRGETRAVHLWQVIHDTKESVSKICKQNLQDMLVMQGVNQHGTPIVRHGNEAIPNDVIWKLFNLQFRDGLTLEDAMRNIRGNLVPPGYSPWPYRRDTPESYLDVLRSIVGTYTFRHSVTAILQMFGADFRSHLYVPEVDPTTGEQHHERGDHNHILKRIATCTRNGNNEEINSEMFVEAMRSPATGLTYTALAGKRKQSVSDAERLLSYHVSDFFAQKGYAKETEYVKIIAQWHEASDGRGLSQLQRCRYNYSMLNYILDEWMPWHKENYDFSLIDINRPVEYIRGLTREVVLEITANIESQELRRCQNSTLGYPEHPRAGSTDDLECFFGIAHSHLGDTFTLKDFKEKWPKLVREFSKRLNDNLPFFYWSTNERYTVDPLPSFDEDDDSGTENGEQERKPSRLHRLRRNQRESVSHFVPGRAFLPARNARTTRQQHHRPVAGVPPASGFLFCLDEAQ